MRERLEYLNGDHLASHDPLQQGNNTFVYHSNGITTKTERDRRQEDVHVQIRPRQHLKTCQLPSRGDS
jgi:hypothetical protein